MTADKTSDPEELRRIADDSLKLFRLNVFVVAVYASAVAITVQGDLKVATLTETRYIRYGAALWTGSQVFALYSYYAAKGRSLVASGHPVSLIAEHSVETTFTIALLALVGTILSMFTLAFGYVEGVMGYRVLPSFPLFLVAVGSLLVIAGGIGLFATLAVLRWMYETAASRLPPLKELSQAVSWRR